MTTKLALLIAPLETLPSAVQRAYRAAGSPDLPALGPTPDTAATGPAPEVLGPELSGAVVLGYLAHIGCLRAPMAFLEKAATFFAHFRLIHDRLVRGGAMGPKRRARAQQQLALRSLQLLQEAEALWPIRGL